MKTMEMFIKNESKYSAEQTVEKIVSALENTKWNVLHMHHLHNSLAKHGYNVPPVTVIEVCRPDYSVQMLSLDEQRIYSSLMPCRISVYDTSEGKVYISRMNSGALAAQAGGITEKVMTLAFRDIEQILEPLVK